MKKVQTLGSEVFLMVRELTRLVWNERTRQQRDEAHRDR
jgi:hypothetical protein